MAETTKGWAVALVVIGVLAIATGLAADRVPSVVVGGVVLAMGIYALARPGAGRDGGA